jgi:hypothetical protein
VTIPLFYLLGAVAFIVVLKQGLSRKVELFSVRNLYLVGFVIYHVVGPIKTITTENYFGFKIVHPSSAANWLLLYAWVYFLVYMFSYHRIGIVRWFAAKFSGISTEAPDSMLMAFSVFLIAFGLPMRLFGYQIPIVGPTLSNVALAMAATACAASGWVWSNRKMNPVVVSLTIAILAGAIGISVFRIYGRRPLIGVLFGFAWGAYYRWARYVPPKKLILYMIPFMIGASVITSAYTAVRREVTEARSISIPRILQTMAQADVVKGSEGLASGQSCSAAMMWALEQYPTHIHPEHLFSLRYMAMYFVPRQIWPNKPEPLSTKIAHLAKLRGVNRDAITLPPGVVGFAAAEGGMYALIIYALFFGQFTRFFDELVRHNSFNPFIILPSGCVIGQFLGLARGDIASFTDIIIVSFLATMILMFFAKLLFGRAAPAPNYPVPWPQSG